MRKLGTLFALTIFFLGSACRLGTTAPLTSQSPDSFPTIPPAPPVECPTPAPSPPILRSR